MKYHITGYTKEGILVTLIKEAVTKSDLYTKIKEEGVTIVSIKEENSKSLKTLLTKTQFGGKPKTEDIILFARNISSMLFAGLALSRALEVIKKQSKKQKMKDIVDRIINTINSGKTLSEALSHETAFSSFFISMVRSGEESGKLPESLSLLADQQEKTYKLTKKIKGAMIYPSVIVVAMIIIAILMMIYVIPTLTKTFKDLNVELPTSTKVVIFVSDNFAQHPIIVFSLLFASIVAVFIGFKTPKGKKVIDFVAIKIPVIGTILKEVYVARITRTLSSLLSSGVEILRSIEITKDVVKHYKYQNMLDEAIDTVEKGGNLSEVMLKNPELIFPLAAEMTAVGEETGSVGDLMHKVALFYEEDVDQKTKDLSTIIEPILMIVIGISVGFFALSMITPMYNITSGL